MSAFSNFDRDDGIPIRSRRRYSSGPALLPWILLCGVLVGVVSLVVVLARSAGGPSPVGSASPSTPARVVDAGEMTEREMVEFLKSMKVKVEYGGGGFLFDPYYETVGTAKVAGCVTFQKQADERTARQDAGSTREGFHWGRWTFTPHGFETDGRGTLFGDIKKALGVADGR